MFVNKWDNPSFMLSWLIVAEARCYLVCKYPWQKWQHSKNNEPYREAKQAILSFQDDQQSRAQVFTCWHMKRDVAKPQNALWCLMRLLLFESAPNFLSESSKYAHYRSFMNMHVYCISFVSPACWAQTAALCLPPHTVRMKTQRQCLDEGSFIEFH